MNALESSLKKLEQIEKNREKEDIKTCYSNLIALSNIINNLELNIYNDPIKEHKIQLKEMCEEEKRMNIEYIINLFILCIFY